jgi:phenylalanyl-tRNA synthetase alpha chain
MLNLVEIGLAQGKRHDRIVEFVKLVADAVGVKNYRLATKHSHVYGETIDFLSIPDELELGSAAMGPHPLDRLWRITDSWVGIGFGLERLLMVSQGFMSLGKAGRSLAYLDGVRLNIP